MKDSYFTLRDNVLASVSLMPWSPDGTVFCVTGVEVTRRGRGQGRAREVLLECLRAADDEGVTLYLSIEPQEPDVDAERLADFYLKHGFRFVQHSVGLDEGWKATPIERPADCNLAAMERSPKREHTEEVTVNEQ